MAMEASGHYLEDYLQYVKSMALHPSIHPAPCECE
jgi:hypothetical protein